MAAMKSRGPASYGMMKGAIVLLAIGVLASLYLENIRALALASLLATFISLAILIYLHLLPTGYNPISHAVSDYAVGRSGHLFRHYLWFGSIGVLALALCLMVGAKLPQPAGAALACLGLNAIGRVAASLFPTDLEGKRLTRTGAIHYAIAFLDFAFLTVAISNLTPLMVALPPWQPAAAMLAWLAWAAVPAVALVVITLLPPLRRVFGLCERLFLVATCLWLILAALLLVI